MRSSVGRILLNITALLGVTLTSAWITLQLIDYWTSSTVSRTPSPIRISEATYGMNCRGFRVAPGQVNSVQEGNATESIAKICEKAVGDCNFVVDVVQLRDPAPGCSKDLSISWYCGANEAVRRTYIGREAHGKSVSIVCPTP